MSWTSELRTAIERGVSDYQSIAGVGPDAYWESPTGHPMAEGKYLSVLSTLRRSQLLSASQFDSRVSKTCERLHESALSRLEDGFLGWLWGLGFPWRNLSASEPFLITTALIVRGALECRQNGGNGEALRQVIEQGVRGLEEWMDRLVLSVDEDGVLLPVYSPGIPLPIYNAAAYGYAALRVAESAGYGRRSTSTAGLSMKWILSRRIPGLGWPYSSASGVVDLLHQCYLLNSFADFSGVRSVEKATMEMVGQFAGACGFADAIHVLPADATWQGQDIPWLRPLADISIQVLPKPARLWSLGELLVLISRLASEGESSGGWLRLGRTVAGTLLHRLANPEDAEARFPRQAMHARHGLACYLDLLRGKARAAPPVPAVEDGE